MKTYKLIRSKIENEIDDQKSIFIVIGLKWAELAGRKVEGQKITGRHSGRDSSTAIPTFGYADTVHDGEWFIIPHPEFFLGTGVSQECIDELVSSIGNNLEVIDN